MILIIDNSKPDREALQEKFFSDFGLNTCATSARYSESAFAKYKIDAAYIPNAETIPNPIGYCRRFKAAHPNVPLIAAVPREGTDIDLDALYRVTDNIPLRPLPAIRLVEIICELMRLYTGRDRLELTCGPLSITPYTFTALYCGCPVELNASALSILRYLCEAAPRPVQTEELTCTTCAPNRKRSPSTIRTHINQLNKKSIAAVGCRMVTHVHGQGYVIGERPKKQ